MAKAKLGGLGKGLDALFVDNDTKDSGNMMLRLSSIEPNKDQPRKQFDEDALMEAALEAGAADFAAEDDVFEIYTEPEDLYAVEDALIAAGYTITSAEKDKIPSNYVTLETEDDIKYMGLLLDNLDENEDVVNVYHNWENQPED